jgi:hypothetical protein
MNGALPPSSSDTFLSVSAAWRISSLPTRVDPVKVILRTSSRAIQAPPIAAASPDTTLTTPAGKPASMPSCSRAWADNGVSSDGLSTTVQPAAKAGPSLRVTMASGKFHGVMAATTPTGSLSTITRASPLWLGITSPYARLPSSANHSKKLAAYATSPRDSARGLPCSVLRISARSSWWVSIRSAQRRSTAARCLAVVCRQWANAVTAWSTAWWARVASARRTRAIGAPSAGLCTG